jgi:predicted RNA-binding Zn ribbon-like protein
VDFINTQLIDNDESVDLFSTVDDVIDWASDLNINLRVEGKNNEEPNTHNELKDVVKFRACLRKLIMAFVAKEPLPKEELKNINQYLLCAPQQKRLSVDELSLSLEPVDVELSIEQLIGKIALDAATLLTSSQSNNIKHCSNHKCVLMFVDTSKSKKRRWCSMDRCGNRAKASTFYHSNK